MKKKSDITIFKYMIIIRNMTLYLKNIIKDESLISGLNHFPNLAD
jgi:hypothetical protein